MLNIINPVTNMQGGGNSLYTHYITLSGSRDNIGCCIEYKTSRATPFTTNEFFNELIAKGFTFNMTSTDAFLPATGVYGNGTSIFGIAADEPEDHYALLTSAGSEADTWLHRETGIFVDIVAS